MSKQIALMQLERELVKVLVQVLDSKRIPCDEKQSQSCSKIVRSKCPLFL